MIHSISCKNFYSIGDETTLDFVVNDNAPDNNGYFKAPSGTRLSKAAVVIGPNASGKTNVLKMMPFMKWLIADSFDRKSSMIPLQPCVFGEHQNKPSEFSAVFEVKDNVYTYNFILNQERILSENLKQTSWVKEKNATKQLFERIWDEHKQVYTLEADNFDLPKGLTESFYRSNASIVSAATLFQHEKSEDIVSVWRNVETNVDEAGWLGDHMFINRNMQMSQVLNFFDENSVLKQEAEKLLNRFDLGLDSFTIKKEKKANGTHFSADVSHSFGKSTGVIPMHYESSGTKQLFLLLKNILLVLDKGGFAVLDEFDVNLHPDMVMALFDLFINPDTNQHNAQILFSTHSHQILNRLDKYQIILVEKNDQGMTESWRLDEMSGVRADDNYFSKYLAGAYGAVPNL